MWPKFYRDYPKDTPTKKEVVHSGKGIIGCEMHESNGWGDSRHYPSSKKRSFTHALLSWFREKKNHG